MKAKSYYTKRAKEIISQIKYLTLATVSEDGTPWNSPVAYAADESFNFYFGSPKDTQHTKNIRGNNKGFVVIYDSTSPYGEGEGVYMTANVTELEVEEEIQMAIKIMFGKDYEKQNLADFMGDGRLRAYKIEPKKVWLNDAEEKDGLFFDYRIEINLKASTN